MQYTPAADFFLWNPCGANAWWKSVFEMGRKTRNLWRYHKRCGKFSCGAVLEFLYTGELTERIEIMENVNELLYMVHMKDEWAMRRLMDVMRTGYESEVAAAVHMYLPLHAYRDELAQEAWLTLPNAVETFQPDRNCSFRVYAALIARRRIWRAVRKLGRQYVSGFNNTVLLEDCLQERPAGWQMLAAKDVLSDPRYVLAMKEAQQRLQETVEQMSDKEKAILRCWARGGKYSTNSEQLGITCKQYEGRLVRVRSRIHKALAAE